MDESDIDEVADIICGVLSATEPTTTAAGGTSQAKFTLDPAIRDATRARSAELLAANPLYPEVGMI